MKNNISKAAFLYVPLLVGIASVCLLIFLFANSSLKAANSDLSKSYRSNSQIPGGALVSLKFNSDNEVVLANSSAKDKLVGVAVAADESLLAVDKNKGNVQVAIGGQATAIVSTINGDIKTGDLVAESIISGVGAKAMPGDKVVGVAQRDFSDSDSDNNPSKSYKTIKTNSGYEVKIAVGSIPVMIALTTENNKNNYLQQLAQNIAGKPVSVARIVLSGLIVLIVIISLSVMIYSSIHSSITAISRNPLAKTSIFESLAQVMVMTALVCVVGIATIYLVIRL